MKMTILFCIMLIIGIFFASQLSSSKLKIAYAITVTKDSAFVDGALVLGYTVRKAHGLLKSNNTMQSEYDIDLVAFVKPGVAPRSREILSNFGWKIIERELPVKLDDIENEKYVKAMKDSGCCGADEFLKLWSFTLVNYHKVIHLDMDSIIFQNMDELFDDPHEFLYTTDIGMGSKPIPPVQGGFLVIKPSLRRFDELRNIIRKGNWNGVSGWEGSHIGKFWGGQTIQGILAYFYGELHKENGKQLNECAYNNMVDSPYVRPDGWTETTMCLTGEKKCRDCQKQKFEDVKSAHFTICQKPWGCWGSFIERRQLCKKLHAGWFKMRDAFERENNMDLGYRKSETNFRDSLGMCTGYGASHYMPIPIDV